MTRLTLAQLIGEIIKDGKLGLVQQFKKEVGAKQCSLYGKRDNCGPAALDFISWAESKGIKGLKRIDGYFKADIPVSSKRDFTREMKQEFLNDGGNWDSAKERFDWINSSKYVKQWKYIPHYWVEDTNGKIYDPSGQQQFIDAGYAKDLNSDRYTLSDMQENYADGKVKDILSKYIDDYTEIDISVLNKLLKDKKKYPNELDPRTGGNKFGYRGMTFKKDFIKKLKEVKKSNGVTEYEVPSNVKVNSRSTKGYLSFTVDEKVAQGFGHYSGYIDHKKSPDRVGGYVRVSLDNPNFILHPDYTGELSKDLEYSKESEKETLFIGTSFKPDRIYVVDEEIYNENYADGKVKGKSRPGRVKRSGASCKGSVTDLRRKAKNASGEKAKMYHWCANMKSGRKK